MDLVPNHTSDQHPWFQDSRSSRNNPKRDWYIWKDPGENGEPPNNWISEFGGSAWEFDSETEQYYYHTFLKEQPDLNWFNPEVKNAMWDVMRFWLDKGVDGFRVDVLWYLIKDKHFRDNPPNPEWQEGMPEHDKLVAAYSSDQPEVHEVISEMRQVTDAYDKRLLIGEIYLPIDKLVTYYGRKESSGVHLPFNFHLVSTEWNAADIYNLIANYEGALPDNGWPNWVLGNHDKSRVKSRIGPNQEFNAAILVLTLRGTPTIYYGEEIGMTDVPIPQDKVQDPREINEPGIGVGRDPQRTPMQWNSKKYAGFSDVEPWLPVSEDFRENNVNSQQNDTDSLLKFYHDLIHLRQKKPALHRGSYYPAGIKDQLLCYKRTYDDTSFLICLNLGSNTIDYTFDFKWTGEILIATDRALEGSELQNSIKLGPAQGMIIQLT